MNTTTTKQFLAPALWVCQIILSIFAATNCDGYDPRLTGLWLDWNWNIPEDIPAPFVPKDNPMNKAKVELGRKLFYDTTLSVNGSQACASCHLPKFGFTDGCKVSKGATGQHTARNSMALVNSAYFASYTWMNPLMDDYETQALVPLLGEEPVELGLSGHVDQAVANISTNEIYPELFDSAFGANTEISLATITKAISAFERSMVSFNSPYDRYLFDDDKNAISDSAKMGMELFFSEKFECFHCHGNVWFNDSVRTEKDLIFDKPFHNTGLYNIDGRYPQPGLQEITLRETDNGKMRAPSLRNNGYTAPYMHDGSVASLAEVLDNYAAGGRDIQSGENAGDGRLNPNKSELVPGIDMSESEKVMILDFLETLNDPTILTNPDWQNPWQDRPALEVDCD